MSPALRFLVILFALVCGALPARAAPEAALERGTAITDPLALRELDQGRFGIGRMLWPERSADIPLSSGQLFALASMRPVRQAIDGEFDRYVARHKKYLPSETIGVGDTFAFQLFDRKQIDADDTHFVLAGIVNRMDRAYVDDASCGEIRLIYRLTRAKASGTDGRAVLPRLPMTLNLVLKARSGLPIDRQGRAITCSEIARRWLAAGELPLTGGPLVEKLLGEDGPLDLFGHENIDRIETNLQIAHASKSAVRDFRTDYLLKVFRYNAPTREFMEAPMENQIDRDRLLADDGLKREFKSWLLDPKHLAEFDRGTVLIPEKFLANGAIAATPVGFDASDLQPEFGLMQGEGANAVFGEAEIVTALKKATADGIKLQNIRSVGGFERRLNDVTCSGCHQTRGIGGFHFPGVDWMAAKPSNSTVVPASPHFFGDQTRRRDILIALRDGRSPDYSRGFASRPQLRGSTELAGTEYSDGWGAHCYAPGKSAVSVDASFRAWTCAEGLACQIAGKTSRMGMCFVKGR
jgi:mono/diheme cytochrome c family protein